MRLLMSALRCCQHWKQAAVADLLEWTVGLLEFAELADEIQPCYLAVS